MSQNVDRRLFLQAAGATILGATAFALAGCAPTASSSGASKVRVAWWGGDVRHAKYNKIYDLYESRHKGVTIKREFADWPSYWERLPTQFAGGNAPDVLHLTERQVGDYASRDQLLDLRELERKGLLDLQYFSEAALGGGTYQGTLVELLVGATIPATLFNTALFEKAGISEPKAGWSWDEFADKAVKLSKMLPEGSYGSTYNVIAAPLFDTALLQDGKSLFAPDGSAELNFDAKDAEDWFARWKDLLDAGGCLPAEMMAEENGGPFEDSSFARGTAAMHVQNSNQLVTMQTAVGKDELHIVESPRIGKVSRAMVMGSYVSINANSKVIEESAKIVDFFVNDPEANKVFGMELGTPGNSNWAKAIDVDLAEVDRRVLDFSKQVEDISVFATARPAGSSRSETLMDELGLAVGFGQLSPADAGTRLVDELAIAIKQAQ